MNVIGIFFFNFHSSKDVYNFNYKQFTSLHFSEQTLQELSSHHQAKYTEAEAEYNKEKNRFPDKLPSECMIRDSVS